MLSSHFRFTLPVPDLPLPNDTVCYRVVLPNSPRLLEAFEGMVQMLSRWTYWERDEAHAAIVAANVFKDVYVHLRENMCSDELHGELEDEMKLRIDPTNSCIIQCLDECSGEWGTFLDVSQCAPGAITQPPPGGTPGLGTTNCYDIVLPGNSQWISPIPIQDGDTIAISGVSGGWFDGAFWRCPNGQDYLLGGCTGSGSLQPSDPAPTILHARLIASIDGGATWVDAYNTSVAIPPGTSPTNLLLQINDPSLSDNGGSITARVCITHNSPSAWTYDVDFTLQSGGWRPRNADPSVARYVLGTGWTSGAPGGSPETMYIEFTALHNCILTGFSAHVNVSAVHQGYQGAALDINNSDIVRDDSLAETPGGTLTFSGSHTIHTGDHIQVIWNVSGSPLGTATCVSVHCAGTGTNPFV